MRSSPFDWDAYWQGGAEDDVEQMTTGAINMARRLVSFIGSGDLRTHADFGCGTGETLLLMARERPDMTFYGFDASLVAIEQARTRAQQLKIPNVVFGRDEVGGISTDERFDLVTCIATLHYVRDVLNAIGDLYERVDGGGFLIFNYPNRPSMYACRRWVASQDRELRDRYHLLLEGENLITLDDIRETLGKGPVNFWRAVGEEPSRENVCVYVRKD